MAALRATVRRVAEAPYPVAGHGRRAIASRKAPPLRFPPVRGRPPGESSSQEGGMTPPTPLIGSAPQEAWKTRACAFDRRVLRLREVGNSRVWVAGCPRRVPQLALHYRSVGGPPPRSVNRDPVLKDPTWFGRADRVLKPSCQHECARTVGADLRARRADAKEASTHGQEPTTDCPTDTASRVPDRRCACRRRGRRAPDRARPRGRGARFYLAAGR